MPLETHPNAQITLPFVFTLTWTLLPNPTPPHPHPKWQRRILYRGFLHTWIVLVEIDDVGGYGDVAVASHMIQVCPDPWYNHKMVIVNGMKCILISRMRGYLFFRQNQKICSTSKIIINPRGHKVAELMGPTKSPFLGSWHQFLMINSQVYQCVAQTILHGTLNSVKLLFVVNVLLCSAGLWFLVNLIIKIQRLDELNRRLSSKASGVLLFEMLFARAPFTGRRRFDWLVAGGCWRWVCYH